MLPTLSKLLSPARHSFFDRTPFQFVPWSLSFVAVMFCFTWSDFSWTMTSGLDNALVLKFSWFSDSSEVGRYRYFWYWPVSWFKTKNSWASVELLRYVWTPSSLISMASSSFCISRVFWVPAISNSVLYSLDFVVWNVDCSFLRKVCVKLISYLKDNNASHNRSDKIISECYWYLVTTTDPSTIETMLEQPSFTSFFKSTLDWVKPSLSSINASWVLSGY